MSWIGPCNWSFLGLQEGSLLHDMRGSLGITVFGATGRLVTTRHETELPPHIARGISWIRLADKVSRGIIWIMLANAVFGG